MSENATPTHKIAARMIFELLQLDDGAPDTHSGNLKKVQSLTDFLQHLEDENSHPCPGFIDIPVPAGTDGNSEIVNFSPYTDKELICQTVPAGDDAPAYSFPLPGQPVMVLGSPENFRVPDGSRWDEETMRWVCEDLRIVAATPAGPIVMTVDSGEFEPWTAHGARWTRVLPEMLSVLESIGKRLEDEMSEASK